MSTSDAYAQGYQDGMQGVEPASDDAEYMRGYMDAPRDRDSGFAGLSAEQLLEGQDGQP